MFCNSLGNLDVKFIKLDIKFPFTCNELNLHENIVNCKNMFYYTSSFQL